MITHERWQRIKEIFHSAQERPPAERSDFLNEVCGDDTSIREEVEGLLTADAGNENFLTSPAFEFAAGMLSDEGTEFAAGERVGRYEILCSLGAGGMGQIYLARDAQLSRNIALKLIAQEFAADPRRVLRFEQEARAASALNHPNVCVIHEIGITNEGRHFIAMEYVQGTTLRDHLARGPLKTLEALQIAIQVGTALASAHAVGIVHRDIKPENIMLRPDGYVKVVDFGLAKLTERLQEQTSTGEPQPIVHTEPRTLMGTVKYMSPEQLREVPIDERTDIWSLGVVLYEMLTGSTPFEARARNDSVALILKPDPVQLTFPETVPFQCREIVKKALEKDCEDRYQTTSKLVSDLSLLKRQLERNAETDITSAAGIKSSPFLYSTIISKPEGGKAGFASTIFTRFKSQAILTADSLFGEIRTHKKTALFAGISSVAFLLFFVPNVGRWFNGNSNPGSPDRQATAPIPSQKMTSLTYSGTAISAAISPDGKWMAHAEEQQGKQRLWVTDRQTANQTLAVPLDEVKYSSITFSPASNYLYFTRNEQNGPGILYGLALPVTTPTRVKIGVDSPISLSPQGDRFAFVRRDETTDEYLLVVSNIDGSGEQVLARRQKGKRLSIYGPAWSPDGSMIVCPASYWDQGYHMNLIAFDVKDGREQLIGQQSWFLIYQVAWQDMNTLVMIAQNHETSPYQIWRIRVSDGFAQRITNDVDNYAGVSISGNNIVTVRTQQKWTIWIAPLDEPQNATAITPGVGMNYGLSWTSKGKIVFSSLFQERLNISSIDPDGSNRVQLTSSGDNYMPAASADGRYIVFSSNRNGPFNIWRMNAHDGSEPTQLTFTDGNFYPSCSADNQWVVYDHVADSRVSFWKVPLQGGTPVKIGEKYRMPVFSPNNQFIAGRYNLDSGTRDVAIFPAEGGEPLMHVEVPIQEWQRIYWLPGDELSYVRNVDGYSNLWTHHLYTGMRKQITRFNSDRIYAYAWSPDYKQVACQRGTNISDVTMISER